MLFSLEMSEAELPRRLTRPRTRREASQGPRLAAGIAEADQGLRRTLRASSSTTGDTGIPEVRAKARRLHACTDGPVGLIVVDLLQLMRPDDRIANVEQVRQISRQLKALAKEMVVPVVVLSQLSRAIEQRAERSHCCPTYARAARPSPTAT